MVEWRCYDDGVRTTVTLDAELAAVLEARAARCHQPLEVVLDDLVRLGLRAGEGSPPRAYRLETSLFGRPRPNYDLAQALQAADDLEDAGLGENVR